MRARCDGMIQILLWVLLLAVAACGQTVRIANAAGNPVAGWVRVTVDVPPLHASGSVGDVRYVVGQRTGLDTWAVDVRGVWQPGATATVDLRQAVPGSWTTQPLPTDLLGHFGGPATIGGAPLEIVALAGDGAGYRAHLRGRFGKAMHADLWLRWYPDQPAVAWGEVLLTCSNPTVPDLTETPAPLPLRWGDALVVLPGRGVDVPVVAPGTRWADGQARALPFVCVWLRHLRTAADWNAAIASAQMALHGVGVRQLWHDGNPLLPAGFNGAAWARTHWDRQQADLHTWAAPVLGPAADSGVTGSQEDQTFHPGGEALAHPLAVLPRYLAGLGFARRPSHHLEQDGAIVSRDRRPALRMFYGRPFRATSPDTLGKPRDLTIAEAGGWNGPDAQHWFFATLASAHRLTGSPACQHLLQHEARRYLIERTTTKGWGTSDPFSAREIGWEGIAVVHLWRELADRALAEQVRAHWRLRVTQVLLPWIGGRDIWQTIVDDGRVGSGAWWLAWHQAIGAYGLDLGCRVLGPVEGVAVAQTAARRVVADAWQQQGARWVEAENLALDGRRHRSGFFSTAWLPCAVAVVLRYEPGNAKAKAIWQQMLTDTATGAPNVRGWLPPGVQ